MVAHGSAFPVAKLALNNSVPPILMASLRMGLVFFILIVGLQLIIGGLNDYGVLSINETFQKYF